MDDEKAEVKPEKGPHHQERSRGTVLLKQILQEVKAARQEIIRTADPGPGFYKRVAKIIDIVFFVLYILTVALFLLIVYVLWFDFDDVF